MSLMEISIQPFVPVSVTTQGNIISILKHETCFNVEVMFSWVSSLSERVTNIFDGLSVQYKINYILTPSTLVKQFSLEIELL